MIVMEIGVTGISMKNELANERIDESKAFKNRCAI